MFHSISKNTKHDISFEHKFLFVRREFEIFYFIKVANIYLFYLEIKYFGLCYIFSFLFKSVHMQETPEKEN